jgi:5-methylcytosine-specific restriction protein B
MNLSHVERYFADFLSVMESKDQLKLHGSEDTKNNVPSYLDWPKNLFIVGTVNIDETTYMFSPKVLDRANVIEFRVNRDDIAAFLNTPTDIDFSNLNYKGASMGEDFINIASNNVFPTVDTTKLNEKLVAFFEELKKTGAEFGYRSATEIHRLYNQLSVLDSSMLEDTKIDIAVMQKLLPKLHGSRRKLCPILEVLASFCVTESTDVIKAFLNNKETLVFQDNATVLYPLSLEKITRMYKGAIDNGFASYPEA